MSTENKTPGFDFEGCHKHRAEQAARIAGIYSNAEPIFLKAKEEGEKLKAKKDEGAKGKDKKDDEGDDEDEDDKNEDGSDDDDDSDDLDDTNADDEKSKIQKAAWNELGVSGDKKKG